MRQRCSRGPSSRRARQPRRSSGPRATARSGRTPLARRCVARCACSRVRTVCPVASRALRSSPPAALMTRARGKDLAGGAAQASTAHDALARASMPTSALACPCASAAAHHVRAARLQLPRRAPERERVHAGRVREPRCTVVDDAGRHQGDAAGGPGPVPVARVPGVRPHRVRRRQGAGVHASGVLLLRRAFPHSCPLVSARFSSDRAST